MKKKLLVLPLALLVAAFALSACGGSSSSSGGDDAAIETAIEESATSEDPKICTEYETASFNEQEYPEGNSIEECEEATETGASVAESVSIEGIEVEGESATAEVEAIGTGLTGQTVELEMIKEEGNWKVNEVTGFASYDGEAFAETIEEALGEEEGVSPELIACIGEGVAEAPQEAAEAFVMEKNRQAVEEIAEGCE